MSYISTPKHVWSPTFLESLLRGRDPTRLLSHPIAHYQQSVNQLTEPTPTNLITPQAPILLILESVMGEFCSVFDGQIRTMTGEKFHILLIDDDKPFCVNTPWSIPFTYQDKLKAELELLKRQNIIAPTTKATEWCGTTFALV